MKNMILEITGGMGLLIAIYLILANFTGSVAVLNAISKPSIDMVKALQGR